MMRRTSLKSYHYVWLASHPERTEQWLSDRLADGFHVHHMNGIHEDDDPKNLVLIESGDHMMIHNGSSRLIWTPSVNRNGGRKKKVIPTIAEMRASLEEAELAEEKNKKKILREKAKLRQEETRNARCNAT